MRALVVLIVLAFSASAARAQEHAHPAPDKLGTVAFETSCSAAAQPTFTRGVALLHSFDYARAIAAFNEALKTDPSCAIAHWGIALSVWGNPFAAGLKAPTIVQRGLTSVEQARHASAKTERERAYIEAVANLYADADRLDQARRLAAYRDAMAAVAAKYPTDTEAAIFAALALAASADPTDKTYAAQLKAGELLERLFAKQPDHPGLAHYIIHSYDVPPLASHALEAARRYSKIAPAAPHALHMPSHTFTRVGYWEESIDANIASAAAAKQIGSTAEELHASDYQAYAYLQTGRDAAATRLLAELPSIAARFDPDAIGGAAPGSAGVFALAAIPARYELERGDWKAAAALEPRPSRIAYADAMTYFARALGASRTGNTAQARADISKLSDLQERLVSAREGYWAEQVRIQHVGAGAWVDLADGKRDQAIASMRAAADAEDRTEKSAVTPGPLAPARELLGEMLLDLNRPKEALKEFEAALAKEPNRFRSIAGAARAAVAANDRAAARTYYEQLLKVCAKADTPGRPELQDARRFLNRSAAR